MAIEGALDKREQILQRLVEIMAEEYIQAKTIVRNRALIKQDDRPAIAIMDADETARLTGDKRGRVEMSPTLVTMRPEIYVIPKSQLPGNAGMGTTVNEFRFTMIRVIAQDPVLKDLVGSNGNIAYQGMVTDLKSGAFLDGQARLDFAFTYVLDPY